MNSNASETWNLQRPHWCWGTHLLTFTFWPCPELPECAIQHWVPKSPSASQALWCHCLVLHHGSQLLHVLWLPQHSAWSLSVSSSPTLSISCSVPPFSRFASRWPCNKSTQGSWTAPGKALFPRLRVLKRMVKSNPGESTVLSPFPDTLFLTLVCSGRERRST